MMVSQLALVYGAYLLATASPGPSNMAIMGVAMRDGRRPALVLAAGVMTGSLCWAMLAATGLSAVLATYAQALWAIKIVGGVYMLYLALRAGKSALRTSAATPGMAARRDARPYRALYRQGVLMHLGNPKAIMSWMAIMSLGLRQGAPEDVLPAIIGGCALLGVTIFGGYALLFSTAPMIAFYTRVRRWIEGVLALLFALAGLELLISRGS
ncbi:LysE family translocator [Serratia marcescens]|uniref:LysE family translocator n=1 Tax=Serratia TaxID=613 RepID=UPI000E2A0BFB|nr:MULTISPECIES: LysE family translocator [Serratia]MBH2641468.1 LysE family translocator [Serratia ureilytica]